MATASWTSNLYNKIWNYNSKHLSAILIFSGNETSPRSAQRIPVYKSTGNKDSASNTSCHSVQVTTLNVIVLS